MPKSTAVTLFIKQLPQYYSVLIIDDNGYL
jgi:hypothetical protein